MIWLRQRINRLSFAQLPRAARGRRGTSFTSDVTNRVHAPFILQIKHRYCAQKNKYHRAPSRDNRTKVCAVVCTQRYVKTILVFHTGYAEREYFINVPVLKRCIIRLIKNINNEYIQYDERIMKQLKKKKTICSISRVIEYLTKIRLDKSIFISFAYCLIMDDMSESNADCKLEYYYAVYYTN